MNTKKSLVRKGSIDNVGCDFSVDTEVENGNIVSAKGYFSGDLGFITKVHWGTTQTLTDEETGINFTIFITKDDFSFSQGYENIEKLF